MSNCTPPVNDPPLKLLALYEEKEREKTLALTMIAEQRSRIRKTEQDIMALNLITQMRGAGG